MAVRVGGVALAHEDGDSAARIGGVGGVPLVAVDDVLVTVAHDARFDVGGVAGRHVGLGHRETRADLAGQQRFQPARLVLGRAVAGQHLHVAGIRRRAIEDLGREERPAHDLAQWRVVQVAETGTVFTGVGVGVGLLTRNTRRQKQVPQPGGAGLGFQLLEDGVHLPGAQRLGLFGVAGLVGVDVCVHEVAQARLQGLYLGAGVEGHGGVLRTRSRCCPRSVLLPRRSVCLGCVVSLPRLLRPHRIRVPAGRAAL